MTVSTSPRLWWPPLLFGAWFILAVALAVRLPAPAPASTGFSLEQARQDLAWIANRPHPVGTRAHAELAERLGAELTRLGLQVEMQQATYIQRVPQQRTRLVHVQNVLARRQGTQHAKSVVLMAHYDSQIGSPGAGDDGVGVAALLEAARVVQASPPPRNDIVFAFTDGEELGLCGAQMFVAEHPWSRNVGAVINFEARGVRGPSMLFETGEGSGWLVREFLNAAPAPYVSSLAPTLYRQLPYATDLNVFRGTAVPRLNFAFAEGWQSYHTWRDAPTSLSPTSILHQGSNAVALATRLGNADLSSHAGEELVYFNLGPFVVRYDQRLVPVVVIIGVMGYLGLTIWLVRAHRVRLLAIVFGALGALVAFAIAVGAAWLLWRVLFQTSLARGTLSLLFERDGLSTTALLSLSAAVALVAYAIGRRLVGTLAFGLGVLAWFAMLAAMTALRLPGISHVFAWPLLGGTLFLFGLAGATSSVTTRASSLRLLDIVAIVAGSAVGLFVLGPADRMMLMALATSPWMIVPLVALTFLWLSSGIDLLALRVRWWMPVSLLAVTIVAAGLCLRPDAASPALRGPTMGTYVASMDSGRAGWLAATPVALRAEARGAGSDSRSLDGYTPAWYAGSVRHNGWQLTAAPLVPAGPTVTVDHDSREGNRRTLTLRVVSPRSAPEVSICLRSTQGLLDVHTNDRPLMNPPSTSTPSSSSSKPIAPAACDLIVQSYQQPADGLPLVVVLPIDAALHVDLVERRYDQDEAPAGTPPIQSEDGRVPESLIVSSRFDWPPASPATR